jgi:uncharacterized protein (TIGR02598 family)
MTMKHRLNTTRASLGFSLVEVTLAVAIAALAIITLLGLLPQGLEMSRKTALITSNSNILEQIARDLDNARFAMLPTAKQKKYFNDQGAELKEDSEEIIYVVEIDPDTNYPASLPKTEKEQPYLKRYIIKIANSNSADFEFDDSNRFRYSTYNHLVAKTR